MINIAESVKKFFEPSGDGVRARDVVRELPGGTVKTAKGIGGYLVSEGQRFFRGTASLGSFVSGKTLTPMGTFQRSLYGTDQPITPTSFGAELGLKGAFAPIAGVALPALDLIPGGKITKTTAVKVLQETDKTGDVVKVLRQLMGVSDDVAKKYAPQIAKTSSKLEISGMVDSLLRESQDVSRIAGKVAGTAGDVAKKVRERGFVTSAKEVIPWGDRVAGVYVPRGTSQLAIKAKNLIASNPAEAERIVYTEASDKAVAIASELIKKYGEDAAKATDSAVSAALYDKAADIANIVATKLTDQGRAIQAASILGRLTPEGQLRFAAREIQKYNEVNPLKRIPELSGEQSSFILKEMKEIQDMPDGLERAMRYQKLQNFISDIVPTPLVKKLVAIWKAGLLTGIKTSGLNLFSNLTHFVSEVAKDIPASMVDSAASLFTGERTKVLTMRKAFDGIKEGSIKGVRYFSTGFDERNIGAKIDYKRVNFGKGPVAKAFQLYTDTVFRALAVGDQPFYYATLSRSLMDQALAQGKNAGLKGDELVKYAYSIVENPTEEMIRIGTADAATSVFINETLAGKAAAKIQSLPGGEFIIPFGRTPSAVGMQAIAYSPIGLAATIIRNIGKGKFNQRDFSQGVGRGLTGTAVLAIGMKMFENKLVSGPYAIGDEKEQKLQEAEGVKPNSVLVDGKWRNPLVLGPAGTVLLAGANFARALAEGGSPTEAMSRAALETGKSFLELPFLTGLQDFVNAVTDPARYAKGYIPGLVASFVPTLVSDVAQASDPLARKTSAPTMEETVMSRIKSRIPGLRQTLEPNVSILGEPVVRAGNVLETMIDPTRPSKQMETPVTMEFRRLHNVGHRVSPTALGDKNGYKVLTPQENTELWTLTGQLIDTKVTALIASDAHEQMDDEQRAKTIENFVERAKLDARATMAIGLTQDLSGEELKKKLSELKTGKLLTKEVYNKYLELR